MPDIPLNFLQNPEARRAFTLHSRRWQENRYVYPVVSRRSKGISIGINLNPDKICNFDCIYCSVDRKPTLPIPGNPAAPSYPNLDPTVSLPDLRDELAHMLHLVTSGEIYRFDPFDRIPQTLRRVNDIAFSGDGEPTTCRDFPEICRIAADLKDAASLSDVKLVLITNATMFHRTPVQQALAFLDQHNGEVWAKLDAGTAGYYDLVDRSPVPFPRLLDNLRWCCTTRPTVIQSLFMRVHGQLPPSAEIDAYAGRLADLASPPGIIKLVQLYTVARQTTEPFATPLTQQELEAIRDVVLRRIPNLPVDIYA